MTGRPRPAPTSTAPITGPGHVGRSPRRRSPASWPWSGPRRLADGVAPLSEHVLLHLRYDGADPDPGRPAPDHGGGP